MVVLNPELERCEAELRCVLAEELGHVATGRVVYAREARPQLWRCEERAFRWAATLLMPSADVVDAVMRGISVYRLSRDFVVTVPFAARVVAWYSRQAARVG
jgi:hypothetical protein